VIERVAAHLATVDHHVVATVVTGVESQPLKHLYNGMGVAREGHGYVVATGDVAKHEVIHVGIDASSSALATVILNTMLLTVPHVHLAVDELVAPKDYSGAYSPSKK